MTRPIRLGYARISHETHALSPLPTELEAFERFHWKRGEELAMDCRPWRAEAKPWTIRNAELSGFWWGTRFARGVEAVPLSSAWAAPSGKLSAHAYQHLVTELLEHLERAGPLDGLFLVLHGAMGVEGEADPEGGLLAQLRETLGEDVPISVVYDMHAILTPSKIDPLTLVSGYKTNPHRDLFARGRVAARHLIQTVRGQLRPVTAWRSLPMVIGGSPTLDFLAPMRSIFQHIKRLERSPSVLECSIFQSQLWHDSPQGGWAVVVQTDGDVELAESLADELAEILWDTRHDVPEGLQPADAAIEEVRQSTWARRLGTVCLADVSDSVGCGAVGENTRLLARLLEAPDLKSFVPIRDTSAIERFWDEDRVDTVLGGSIAPEWCDPIRICGPIVNRVHTDHWGRALVVDLDHVQLVITEFSPMTVSPGFYREVGLEPWLADAVVVKSLFLFRLYFFRENRRSVYARTLGMTDLDVYERITYDRPVHPKDPVSDWRPGDRQRRSIQVGHSTSGLPLP